MKKCNKVILILYFRDLVPEVHIFDDRKQTVDFVKKSVLRLEEMNFYKYDIYFGFLAEHFEE